MLQFFVAVKSYENHMKIDMNDSKIQNDLAFKYLTNIKNLSNLSYIEATLPLKLVFAE